jgi:Na+/H+-dicarboxylate symporter
VAGDAFIMLLQMTVIPYIVVALIVALGRLDYQYAKRLALTGGGVLLAIWGIGLMLVFLEPIAFPDWPSTSFFSKSLIEEPEPVDFLALYIPANPFHSLANAVVPAIVVFSLLMGLALIGVDNKAALLEPLSAVAAALMRITELVARLAPLGVFAIIASAAGTLEIQDLGRLQVYVVTDIVLAIILSFWILPGLITALTPLRYDEVIKAIRSPLITAFATGSILIVLPLLAQQSKELLATLRERTGEDGEQAEASVDILIPTFFAFPNLGLVMSLGFALFAGWYVGSPVSVADYPTLGLAGLASLFGGPVLAIPFLLDILKLPADLFHLYITADVLSSRFGTLLAAMHLATIGLIGAFAMQGAARVRLVPLLRMAAVSVLMVGGALVGLRALYTHVLAPPYLMAAELSDLPLFNKPRLAKLFEKEPAEGEGNTLGRPRTYAEIRESDVLRVCYEPFAYPMAYFNSKGNLVGFDIDMVLSLARELRLGLEFVPLLPKEDAIERLNAGYCDIAAHHTPVTPENILRMDVTEPFATMTTAFLLPDHLRDDFASWARIRSHGDIRIAAYWFEFAIRFVERNLPEATLVLLQSAAEQRQLLEAGLEDVDAILGVAEEQSAWTILYPRYTVVVPRPVLSYPVGYALPKGSGELLKAVNSWLLLAQGDGTIDELYDYWIQGKIEDRRPPRWSVIRDVLGWID